MAVKRKTKRFNEAPPMLTADVLRAEFVAFWSRPEFRKLLLGTPSDILLDPDARPADKLAAWEKVVNRLGLSDKQQLELLGGLRLEDVTSSAGVPIK